MEDNNYQFLWEKVEPLLLIGKLKDFLLHSRMVERAIREIISGEGGKPDILIPAAIF